MDLAIQRAPSLWGSLLWKDFQQIKSTLVAVSIGIFAIQLFMLTIASLISEHEARQGLYQSAASFACIAPILVAIGCSGMLIGQERQSGTWGWSTSLPVTWQQALISKLVVAFSGSIAVGLLLGLIPILLFVTNRLETGNNTLVAVYASGLTFFVLCEVVVFFFLVTLLIREPLVALVVAGIGLTIGQGLVGSYIGLILTNTLHSHGFDRETAGNLAGPTFLSSFMLCGILTMIAVFRWRWGLGQHAALALSSTSSVSAAPWGTRYRYEIEKSPSLLHMLTLHSLTNSFWLRISVLVGTLLYCLLALPIELVGGMTVIIGGILGLSAFEGDQTLQRIRFLADRGVNPRALVLNRFLVALAWTLVCFAIVLASFGYVRGMQPQVPAALIIGLVVFTLSAFTTMCFRRPMIAATLTAAVVLGTTAIWQAVCAFFLYSAASSYQYSPHAVIWIFCQFSPLAFLILIVAMFRMSRAWIIDSGTKLEVKYLRVIALAVLLPLFVASHFLYQVIPYFPWQGLTPAERAQPAIAVPDLDAKEISFFSLPFNYPPIENSDENDRSRATEELIREVRLLQEPNPIQLSGELDKELSQGIEPLLASLEQALRSPRRVVPTDRSAYVNQLNNAIVRTAYLAEICTRIDAPASAVKLWKANRELQEIAQNIDAIESAPSRIFALRTLANTSQEQLDAMGGYEFITAVTPRIADERSALVYREKLLATIERDGLTSDTAGRFRWYVRSYPPLRWIIERRLALELRYQLNRTQNQRMDSLTGNAYDELFFWIERARIRSSKGELNTEPEIDGGLGDSIPALPGTEAQPETEK